MAWNIAMTEKDKNKPHISYMSEAFWDKLTDVIDDPVVQCDVPAVKNTSLDVGNNDDCKYIWLVNLMYCFCY